MSNNLKLIIGIIVLFSVVYFGWGLVFSPGGEARASCDSALAAFEISDSELDCDWLCSKIDEMNTKARDSGPPPLDQVRNLTALVGCIKERDDEPCACFEE